jgi:serine/threonine protein phosphatase PrpC
MTVYSHSLQGHRISNEDHHIHILNLNNENLDLNPINFFGVFDGHGGKTISKFLKDTLPYYFINKFKHNKQNTFSDNDLSCKYINKVYNRINAHIMNTHPIAANRSGSTACCIIHYLNDKQHNLLVINVGDSRAVKCNKLNIAEQLCQDHKPCSPEERKRIENLGGKIEFDGSDWRIKNLSLSRAFGDKDCHPYVTYLPQIYGYNLNQDKFIILACDGLWDILSNQDAVDFINNLIINKFKGNYSKALAEYALKKGSMDNITVIVYFL